MDSVPVEQELEELRQVYRAKALAGLSKSCGPGCTPISRIWAFLRRTSVVLRWKLQCSPMRAIASEIRRLPHRISATLSNRTYRGFLLCPDRGTLRDDHMERAYSHVCILCMQELQARFPWLSPLDNLPLTQAFHRGAQCGSRNPDWYIGKTNANCSQSTPAAP
jgi:hypothetical protein